MEKTIVKEVKNLVENKVMREFADVLNKGGDDEEHDEEEEEM